MKENKEKIELVDVKKALVEAIDKKYGSVAKFLETDFGKKLGQNVRTYLYPSGATSYEVLRKLCKHFGLGELTRKNVVTRSVIYKLNRDKKSDSVL